MAVKDIASISFAKENNQAGGLQLNDRFIAALAEAQRIQFGQNTEAQGQITPDLIAAAISRLVNTGALETTGDQSNPTILIIRHDGKDTLDTPPPHDEANLRSSERSEITVVEITDLPSSGITVENLPDLTPGSGYNDFSLDGLENATGITIEQFDHDDIISTQEGYLIDQNSQEIEYGFKVKGVSGSYKTGVKIDNITSEEKYTFSLSGGISAGSKPKAGTDVKISFSRSDVNPFDFSNYDSVSISLTGKGEGIRQTGEIQKSYTLDWSGGDLTVYESTITSDGIKTGIYSQKTETGVKNAIIGELSGPQGTIVTTQRSSTNQPRDAILEGYYTDSYYSGLVDNGAQEFLDQIGMTPDRFQDVARTLSEVTGRSQSSVMSELSDTLAIQADDYNAARQDYGLSPNDALNVAKSYQNGFEGSIDDIVNAPRPEPKPQDYAAYLSRGFSPDVASYISFQRTYNGDIRPAAEIASEYYSVRDSNASIPANFTEDLPQVLSDARAGGDQRPADEILSDYYQGAGFTEGAANRLADARLNGDTRPLEDIHDEYYEYNDRINETTSVIEQRDYDMFAKPGESQWDFEVRQAKQSDDFLSGAGDFFGGLFGGGQTTAPADPAGTTRGLATDPAQTTPPADPAQTTPKKEENDSSSAEDRAEREAAEKSYSDRGFSSDIASDIADAREDGDHRTADDIASEAHGVDDDDGSDNGGGRVICTYFYQKGELSRTDWAADLRFTQDHISQQTVRGYHLWAIPTVRLMRGGGLAGRLLEPAMRFITLHRAHELAYRMGRRDQGNLTGKLIRWTMEPVCWALGALIKEQDWQSLYTEQDVKA